MTMTVRSSNTMLERGLSQAPGPGRPRRIFDSERSVEERNRIVVELQWLVRAVARTYRGRGMEFEDLVSEGQFGLLRAAELYDPSYGKSMAAYATRWVRQSIAYGVAARASLISVPHGARCLAARFRKEQTDVDESEETSELERFLATCAGRHRPSTLRASLRARSLRRTAFPDDTRAGTGRGVETSLARVENREWVESALARLPEREAAVLRARFGINTEGLDQTLRGIGRRLGLGRERTRQLAERGLGAIRAWASTKQADRNRSEMRDAAIPAELSSKNAQKMMDRAVRPRNDTMLACRSNSDVKSTESDPKRRLMTQAEVADELGINRRYVVRWARSGAFDFPQPVKVVARTYLFDRREIESWELDRAWTEARWAKRS